MKDPNEKIRVLLFGDSIRRVNIARIADEIGQARNTVYNWKKDPSLITVSNLRKLCKAQGIDYRELGEAIGNVEGD